MRKKNENFDRKEFDYPKFSIGSDHMLDSLHYELRHWRLNKIKQMEIKQMKINKKKTIEIPVEGKKKKVKREITICVLIDEDEEIRAGYSVRMLQDKSIEDKSEKIAEGRARKDRTNMVDMKCGRGMDRKFILHAVADSLFIGIERSTVKIKGIR